MKKIKRIAALFLTAMAAMGLLIGTAAQSFAGEPNLMPPLDDSETRTLEVNVNYKTEEGTVIDIPGVTIEICQVASLAVNNGSADYTLTEAFAETGISFDGMTASESNEAAQIFAEIAEAEGVEGLSGMTDINGKIYYNDLENGIYLLRQTDSYDKNYSDVEPFLVLVPLPVRGEEENTWNYHVQVYPKMELSHEEPEPGEPSGRINVTKKMEFFENPERFTIYAKEAVYYVGLFMDPAGTVPYTGDTIKEIHIVEGVSGTAVFEKLPNGTYYVFETDKDGNAILPDSYVEDDEQGFVCEYATDQKVEISLGENKLEGNVEIHNVYVEFPEGFSVLGKLMLTKKVLNPQGESVTVDDTFYAGVFVKKGSNYNLAAMTSMEQNGEVVLNVPLGGENQLEEIEYWIFETDQDGNRVSEDPNFGYRVEGEACFTFSMFHLSNEAVITNHVKEPTPTPSGSSGHGGGGHSGGGTSSSTGIKTGDDTMILTFVLLFLGALSMIVGISIIKKRQR